jgi:hypothetical protein
MTLRLIAAVCILLSHSATTLTAAPPVNPATEPFVPQIPEQSQILSTLRTGHPRLLATASDFQRLKALVATDPVLQKWVEALRKDGQSLLDQKPMPYVIPDGKRLLDTSRGVMHRVYRLAMLYRIDGDRKWADRCWKELENAANFKDWNPNHFLDTAEMTHAFAIGYDWLYDAWTPQQRKVIRDAIIKHGLTPGVNAYRNKGGRQFFKDAVHNWNQVCNGGLAIGALAIGDEEPALAAEILHGGLRSLPKAMAHFAPDGAWAEGPAYWGYTTQYTVAHLAAMQTALGTDFDYSEFPGFSVTGDFPIHCQGPSGIGANFADASPRAVGGPQMFWLASRFRRPDYARFQLAAAAGHPLEILWYQPGLANRSVDTPLDRHFRGTEVVTMRSSWTDPTATWLAFKAGSNAINHSHLDLGSFIFEALGVRWAVDLGADNYNLPGYFGKGRWDFYRLRAEAHNTLVINPGPGADQNPRAMAPITEFRTKPCCASAKADLTAAYAPAARRVQRMIQMGPDREHVFIIDEVKLKEPGEVWWFMNTRARIEIRPDGRSAMLTQNGQKLLARIISPASAKFSTLPASPLPTSPNPANQRENKDTTRLTITVINIRDLELGVVLTPILRPEQATEPPPNVLLPSEW